MRLRLASCCLGTVIALSQVAGPARGVCVPDSIYVGIQSIAAEPGTTGLAAGDFNRDGRTDLAIVHRSSRITEIWHGRSGGAFERMATFTYGTLPTRAAVADFDLDGWPDLAILDGLGRVFFLRGTATGFVGNGIVITEGAVSDIVTGEFNGDGRPDVVVTKTSNGTLLALFSSATPFSFTATTIPIQGTSATQPFGLLAADLNSDSYLDLAVIRVGNGDVAVLPGGGVAGRPNGTFGLALNYPAPGGGLRSLARADADADGIPDLVFAGLNGVGYLRGRATAGVPNGSFDPTPYWNQIPNVDIRDAKVVAGDLDGTPDLLVVSGSRGGIGLLVGQGAGGGSLATFGTPIWYSSGNNPGAFHVEDLSGDGRMDAVVAPEAGTVLRTMFARCDSLPPARPAFCDPPDATPEVTLFHPVPPDPGPRPPVAPWPLSGVSLCAVGGDQLEMTGVDDHAHGAYFVWRDRRAGGSDIYALRIGADGQPRPGWAVGGTRICGAAGEQYSPRIWSDGTNGAWAAWVDERGGSSALFIQRLGADGSVRTGWPADGRYVAGVSGATTTGTWSDLEEGLVLLWAEQSISPARYRRLHLDSAGNPVAGTATDSGTVVFTSRDVIYNSCEFSRSSLHYAFPIWPGSTVLGFEEAWQSCPHIPCSNCIGGWSGTVVLDRENGQRLFQQSFYYSEWKSASDDRAGGIFLTGDLGYIQRIGFYGHPSWERWPPLPSTRLVRSDDGYFALGQVQGDSAEALVRIRDDGQNAAGWSNAGVRACASCGFQTPAERALFAPDGAGGALLVWRDRRNGSTDLYANWIRGNTEYGWTPNGLPITRTSNEEIPGGLIGNGKGDAIVYWQDSRNGNADLWAYRLSSSAPPPAASPHATRTVVEAGSVNAAFDLRLDGFTPNPSAGDLSIRFQLPRTGRADICVADIAGRMVLRRSAENLAAGPHLLKLTSGKPLAPGVYVIRLEFAGTALTRRAVVVR